MNFTVRVLHFERERSLPRVNEQVTAFSRHEHSSGNSLSATTDAEGIAYFSCDWQVGGWDVPVTVFVAGSKGAEYLINEGQQVTIVYDD